ncbi:MAG TPA: phosphatase PAP2 family protein [Nocardioidaceae bacterium]|nr:phosphatase PAP2 family protein [Nocardioidaceae bacterium]
MKRRAYGLLVGVAVMTGLLAVVVGQSLGLPLRDPEGFLGPAWIRLPLLVLGAFLADVVPRSLWRSRGRLAQFRSEAETIIREHWTRERISLVVIGLVSFYVTYVGYRNLKNYLPFIREGTQDPLLKAVDEAIFFGGDPAIFLHTVLGEGVTAHILSFIYLIFLPFVPISVTAWLVWSRNISFGYWYVTAQCLAWALGTASYYAIPSLGPAFYYVWLYSGLEHTGVTQLQDSLFYGRSEVRFDPFGSDGVQSVAGFASLHVAITLVAALVAHYTVRHAWIRWGIWVFFGLTVISTIYFGWHYIADDVAGALIAIVAVYLGGLATGQKFDRHGLASHPTTSTADVPVEEASARS